MIIGSISRKPPSYSGAHRAKTISPNEAMAEVRKKKAMNRRERSLCRLCSAKTMYAATASKIIFRKKSPNVVV